MIFKKRDKKETRVRTLFKDNNNQKKTKQNKTGKSTESNKKEKQS